MSGITIRDDEYKTDTELLNQAYLNYFNLVCFYY